MRCFYILIHGRLRWLVDPSERESDRPAGLYCHRYVLASDQKEATRKALKGVSNNLDQQTGWLRGNLAELELEVEKVNEASLLKAFLPVNKGHTFYDHE